VGVDKNALVDPLWTLYQKLLIPFSTQKLEVKRSAPYVRVGSTPNPKHSFCLFFFFVHVLCFFHRLGTKTTCSASYDKGKPE